MEANESLIHLGLQYLSLEVAEDDEDEFFEAEDLKPGIVKG